MVGSRAESPERKREQKKRWFATARNDALDAKDTISVAKRRDGLTTRCRYKSDIGMQRWVGLGVISDNSSIWGD